MKVKLYKTLLLIEIMSMFFFSNLFSAEPNKTDGNVSYVDQFAILSADYDVYVIHPGDKLNIQVLREKELSGVFVVSPSGRIDYPLLGEVYIDGFSMDELKKFLVDGLSREYLVNPQIQIDFEESPNRSVTILGQVTRPGNYMLSPNLTLARLISQVGGLTSLASSNNVRVIRMNKDGIRLNALVDVQKVMKGEIEDIKLMPGDMVFVDKIADKEKGTIKLMDSVSILGAVAKPGNYAYAPGLTLVKLISEAGGFTGLAAPNRVKIMRSSANGEQVSIQVDANKILDGKAKDVALEQKDLVVVSESFF